MEYMNHFVKAMWMLPECWMITIINDMHDSLGTNYVYESKDEQERFTPPLVPTARIRAQSNE